MAIVDCNELPDRTRIQADLCIIGAGAAGLTLAAAFDGTPTRVCLVESGGMRLDDSVQALYDCESVGHPVRSNFMSRARYFGGTSNLWAGRCMRLGAIDLRERGWVAHSGWPIAWEELTRYYDAAGSVLGLPAFAPYSNLGARPDLNADEIALLGAPTLETISVLWGTKPLRFGRTYRRLLERSANVTGCLNGSGTRFACSEDGARISALTVRTLGGRSHVVEARRFVLACGGLENARLMLVLRDALGPVAGSGLDLAGRFFLDHPRAIYGHVRLARPMSLPYVLGVPIATGKVQLGLRLTDREQERASLLNSYVSLEPQMSELARRQYESAVSAAMVLLRKGSTGPRSNLFRRGAGELRDLAYLLTPKEIMPHPVYRLYAWAKRNIRGLSRTTDLTVVNYCEQAPNPSSRVYLGERRDALGLPQLLLDWRLSGAEAASLERIHEILAQRLAQSGIGTLETDPRGIREARFTDASHHIGTLRMGGSPKTGVVDENCRVHGFANLFVAGSAVFPTAGNANPTLTIVALALRLADHLKASPG